MVELLWLVPALPLAGFVILVLAGRRMGEPAAGWIATLMVTASFVVSCVAFVGLVGLEDHVFVQTLFTWIPAGDFLVDIGLYLDPLSGVMILFITGISALIHLYSIGYMHGDANFSKFFIYLNLFVFSMLVLVLGDNLLLTFLGWEGVGACSYFLISFWFTKPANASAGKKAFVTNRIGDWGFLVGIFMVFFTFGSLNYSDFLPEAGGLAQTTATFIAVMLFIGAIGKSAQLPLSVWLPDAMAGPTPVSALIHAATMVTAGVYLIVRSGPVFNLAPTAQTAVVIVGAVTLLFGAIIGCAKDDIKKALAASTMSQIGYMVLAAGLGPAGYAVAIMHLITHGFFKAGLFLGAGSVMHACNDETDMRRFGGLRSLLPVTFVTFGLGYLAIIGVPPFAGFFSKDAIIETALNAGGLKGVLLGGATLLGAAITAFYMTRVMLLTFFGAPRWKAPLGASEASGEATALHPHESPAVMTVPMVVLALGSVGAGALLSMGHRLQDWLEPVVGSHEAEHLIPAWAVTAAALSAIAIGVAIAYRQYAMRPVADSAPQDVSALTVAARRDLYGDAINEAAFMRPGQQLTRALLVVDDKAIEGSVAGLAATVSRSSDGLRGLQTGFARTYALSMLAGTALVAGVVLITAMWR